MLTDPLQVVLEGYHASILHAHRCHVCGHLCTCAQTQCRARWDAKADAKWECFICREKAAGEAPSVTWGDTGGEL
jgi:hypothetical protein